MKILDLFTRVDKLTVDVAKEISAEKGTDEVTFLDVREPSEYEAGHIPGSEFMPLSNLPDRLHDLDREKKIITYCKRGPRSRSAAALLKQNGFNDVLYMDGGIDAWNGLVASGQYEAGLTLLEGKETVEDLVSLAWALEDGTGSFYQQVMQVTDDGEAQEIFEPLIRAEASHKQRLSEAYRRITGSEINDRTMQENATRGYMEGGVSVDDTLSWIKQEHSSLEDILELSMQIETNSLDLYMKMLREIKDDSAQKVLNELIEEEKKHLSRLGKLFDSKIKSKDRK